MGDEKFYRPEKFKKPTSDQRLEEMNKVMTRIKFLAKVAVYTSARKEVETGVGRVNLN